MAKRKRVRAAEMGVQVGILRMWTSEMNLTSKEEGSEINYDEPAKVLTKEENTWLPRLVILSSLWAFKLTTEDSIPSSRVLMMLSFRPSQRMER